MRREMFTKRTAASAAIAASGLLLVAACGGSSSGGKTKAGNGGNGSGNVPDISATAFTSDFSVMAQLKGLASSGKGKIGVLLPDTVTSARYVEFDAPYLTKAFQAAG